jgi:hypothetical protein
MINDMISSVLNHCNNNYLNDNKNTIINAFLRNYHYNILTIFNNIVNDNDSSIDSNIYWNISEQLNKCYYIHSIDDNSISSSSSSSNSSSISSSSTNTNEYITNILLYVSVVIWPGNHVAMKYLGLKLIDNGFYSAALKLYDDCIVISDDYGCILYHVFITPSHYWSYQHTNTLYYNIIKKVNKALIININIISSLNPINSISSTPTYMQYLGISPRILSESYSKVINHNTNIDSNSNNNTNNA